MSAVPVPVPRRVLLVDDDAELRRLRQEYLARHRFEVVALADASNTSTHLSRDRIGPAADDGIVEARPRAGRRPHGSRRRSRRARLRPRAITACPEARGYSVK